MGPEQMLKGQYKPLTFQNNGGWPAVILPDSKEPEVFDKIQVRAQAPTDESSLSLMQMTARETPDVRGAKPK
ncbi:unnamed protein product [Ranitomeya imitator]|uniref:Uncharacterized protein n=1 Tax=Ranitomeya imitator TaxID=111125 RepID=A0ABN9L1R8_9NEOB|nr:unnamed protein product [Ranitomeya imitator]